jgi:hypothetical protein
MRTLSAYKAMQRRMPDLRVSEFAPDRKAAEAARRDRWLHGPCMNARPPYSTRELGDLMRYTKRENARVLARTARASQYKHWKAA